MKNTRLLMLVLFLSVLAFHAFGQIKIVFGTLRDEKNKSGKFATVAVRNTTTATNEKGEYSINVPKSVKILLLNL